MPHQPLFNKFYAIQLHHTLKPNNCCLFPICNGNLSNQTHDHAF